MNLGITLTVEPPAQGFDPRTEEAAVRWCPRCGAEVMMVGLWRAAALDFTDERTIHLWAEAGKLHIERTPDVALLVCLD